MPTPQKHVQKPMRSAHVAPQRYQLPISNGLSAAPQQPMSKQQQQQQQQQQMAWHLAQSRAQQQNFHHQAQRQSALRQAAVRQPSTLPLPTWQQQQQPQQPPPQQHPRGQVSQGIPANAVPKSQGQQRSIVQQWASHGMQAMPPGAYLLPQQLQAGGVSGGYLVQPSAAVQQGGLSQQPSAQHMQGAYQHIQQRQQYVPQGGRMVPVHDAQQRVAQMGQPALLNGPRVSMQRLGPDFMPISPMGCADGGSAEAANPLKRSFSGDAGLPPPTKKLASLQQLHHTTLPVLRRPEDFKPF